MDWHRAEVTEEEERAIAAFMARVAAARPDVEPRLPDADVLRIKARLVERWKAERTVQAPLDLMEPIQIVAGLAAAALLLVWTLPSLLRLLPAVSLQ